MNRNNFFIHLALALVLILVAAFAGQLSRWRKQWKSHIGPIPSTEKKRATTTEEIALSETRFGRPEVLVKFKSGVSQETIERLTALRHDRVEDRIENVEGLRESACECYEAVKSQYASLLGKPGGGEQ